jgi:hypothetical protein
MDPNEKTYAWLRVLSRESRLTRVESPFLSLDIWAGSLRQCQPRDRQSGESQPTSDSFASGGLGPGRLIDLSALRICFFPPGVFNSRANSASKSNFVALDHFPVRQELQGVFALEELLFTRALSIIYGRPVPYRFGPRIAGSLLLSTRTRSACPATSEAGEFTLARQPTAKPLRMIWLAGVSWPKLHAEYVRSTAGG